MYYGLAQPQNYFLLLIGLVVIDYLLDLYHVYRTDHESISRKTIWEQTKLFGTKIIFYSIMVIVINALQLHLVKDLFDLFRWVIAVPIIGEVTGILTTIEIYTGIKVQGALKKVFKNFLSSKGVDETIVDEQEPRK